MGWDNVQPSESRGDREWLKMKIVQILISTLFIICGWYGWRLNTLYGQGHEIDSFGIGTHLVTCYAQPALGVVFKLVEINDQPRIKLSEDVSKVWLILLVTCCAIFGWLTELALFQVSIPCKKRSYRLYGKEGYPLVDIMTGENEPPPKVP